MTVFKNFLAQNLWKIALLLFALGGAWTQQVSALSDKADKADLAAIMDELKDQRRLIEDVRDDNVADHATIKVILCEKASSDSWCK
jgi:hypothetical protein